MSGAKVSKLFLNGQGSYLGMEKGCFTVKDKDGKVKGYPLFEKEISEVGLKSGNCVSTGALASLGFWDIDVMIMTQRDRPVPCSKAWMMTAMSKPDYVNMKHTTGKKPT